MREKFDNIENCDELEELGDDLTKEELEVLDAEIEEIRAKDDHNIVEVSEELSIDGLTTRTIVIIECSNRSCSESSEYDPKDVYLSEEQAMNRAAQHFDSDYVEIDGCYYHTSCYEYMVNNAKINMINELIEAKKEEIKERKRREEIEQKASEKAEIRNRRRIIEEKRAFRIRENISYGLEAIDTVIQARLALQEKAVKPTFTAHSSLTEQQIEWITTVYSNASVN